MAGRDASTTMRSQASSKSFMTVLASAVFEWLLIFMLFINAILAYLITRFAEYCQLPIPCLLCSRFDHLLGNGSVGLYWDLMCGNHKSEISSLVLCNLHNKLVDVHGMCESCLFSFATKDKSNSETYRLLVGKMGTRHETGVKESPLLDNDQKPASLDAMACCCCSKPWTSRRNVQALIQTKSADLESVDVDDPFAQEMKPCKDVINNNIQSPYHFASSSFDRGNVEDPLSRFGYSELRISSDAESEIQVSDTEDLKALASEAHLSLKDLMVDAAHVGAQVIKFVDDSSFGKPIGLDEASNLIDEQQCDLVESHEVPSTKPNDIDDFISGKPIVGDEPSKLLDEKQCNLVGSHESPTTTPSAIDGFIFGKPSDVDEPSKLMDEEQRDLVESHEIPSPTPNAIDNFISEKPIDLDEPSKLIDEEQSDLVKSHEIPSPTLNAIDDFISEKPIDVDEPSKLIDEKQCDSIESHEITSSTPNGIGHGLEELSWQHVALKAGPSSSPNHTHANGVPERLSAPCMSVHPSTDTGGIVEEKEIPADDIKGVNELETVPISADYAGTRRNSHAIDVNLQIPNNLDIGTAYKLAISSRGRQLSGKLLDQLTIMDSTRVSEDLKLLLSAARGLDSPVTSMLSPRVSGFLDGLKVSDSSASGGFQTLQSIISLERNDSRKSLDRNGSGFESLSFSTVSEVEGESEVELLKRQVEHDKKVLRALLKELEEEKSASAVSANQAMAMINKLQEEKAALQMEALHDIRIMEEQAEYDMKALERANDLLVEKEKEIQDLETELDYYRIKYSNELAIDNEEDNPASRENHHGGQANMLNFSVKKIDSSERADGSLMDCQNSKPMSSWLEFEDERLHILKCFSDLEKKLHLFLHSSVHSDLTDQGYHEAIGRGADSKEGSPRDLEHESKDGAALKYGEEGFCFVEEIASHLRELRSMIIRRNQPLS